MRSLAIRPAIGAGLLLLLPLTMTILDSHKPKGEGWSWSPLDFVVMGALLFGAGLSYEYVSRKLVRKSHRVALGIIVLLVVLVIWVELAVDGVSQIIHYIIQS